MSQMRLVFNSDGFRQILTSEGCHALIQSTTDQIREKAVANYAATAPDSVDASEGITSSTMIGGYGGGRWLGFVSTANDHAAAAEANDKILTRAAT